MEQLRILSICYYVFGALSFCCGSFPLIHVAIGIGIMMGIIPMEDGGQPAPPGVQFLAGGMFTVIGGAIILLAWAMAAFAVYTGWNLAQRRRHTLCIICAAIICVNMPLGTILGVLTLVCLIKEEVKAEFES